MKKKNIYLQNILLLVAKILLLQKIFLFNFLYKYKKKFIIEKKNR